MTAARERSWVAAIALLLAATTTIAWLPVLAGSVGGDGIELRGFADELYLAACGVAGAAFLALAARAYRTAAEPQPARAARAIWIVALALRAPALFAPVWLSDDVWRYRFEGAVQRAGFSPFAEAPSSPRLDFHPDLDAGVRARVAHPEIPAVYPPLAQLFFRVAAHGELGWKLVVAAADLALLALLLRELARRAMPPALALIYAWHPLVVLEFCGSGHVDALALLLAFAAITARGGPRFGELRAGALAGLAGMVKPQGFLPLVGFVARRRFVAATAALVAAGLLLLPFASDGGRLFDGLRRYGHDWEFNALLHPSLVRVAEVVKALLEGLPDPLWYVREVGYAIVPNQLARTVALLAFAGLVLVVARRLRELRLALALAVLAAFLATSPTVHPWYVAWLVPFLPFVPREAGRALLLFSVTTLVAGSVQAHRLASGIWEESAWVGLFTWLPPCLLGAFDLWRAPRAQPELVSGR